LSNISQEIQIVFLWEVFKTTSQCRWRLVFNFLFC
jgi:hypothetical protein